MWNGKLTRSDLVRTTVMRWFETSFYTVVGALLVGQLFFVEGYVTMQEALPFLAGEALWLIACVGGAPVTDLLTSGRIASGKEEGEVIPFRSAAREEAREEAEAQEERRRAA